jgi:DNA-binding LacI/PurR family transcriptional regulator
MDERPDGDPAKPPTMEDVAARAGVSRALVSIVFRGLPGASPDNRERVRRAAEEIGFRPDRRASLLGRKRTNLLGVAFGVGHEFHADLIAALYRAVAHRHLELVLSGVTDGRPEQQAVAELLSFRCDALLLLGPTLSTTELAAIGARSPVVVLARAVAAPGVEVVRTDDELGARLATEHLLGLGHRTIVHLDGRRAPGGAVPATDVPSGPTPPRRPSSRSTTGARSASCRPYGLPACGSLATCPWSASTTAGSRTPPGRG